ncbi:HAD-IA family hydrolase [Aureimonas sp. ME7]|uniref:HAD-IA family hydrolase n=1 Tax=Aureimonas sp. ME7 TaxID=2744252 RepID=UPI0015F6C248|nr:HAD-IA family hydrolase [Aureimonas sp. ME7]
MPSTAPHPHVLIFDLDGTLIDSAHDIAAAVNEYLASRGWPAQDPAFVEGFIGNGPRRLLLDLLKSTGLPHDNATVDEAVSTYIANYERNPTRHTRFYPHVEEDLRRLHRSGFSLGLCTNKPHALTLKVLDLLGIASLFEAVVGADAAPACKPDPAHLLAVCELMGADRNHVAYVGDTAVDQATAASAGIPFHAVPWGGGSLLQVEPGFRLERLADLLALRPAAEFRSAWAR